MAQGMTGGPMAGLLHTVPALAVTFDGLIRAAGRQVRPVHVADAWLLETVRRDGVTREVHETVVAHARGLFALGAQAVLVTCSSIGELAEAAAKELDAPVLRVDALMADEAVRLAAASTPDGGRVAVLATLPSTLRPTRQLVWRAGELAGVTVEVTAQLVEGAAEAHDRGDRERVVDLVAAAVAKAAAGADVIVLAQASMAAAAERAEVAVPVLTSPAGGVRSLLAALPQGV